MENSEKFLKNENAKRLNDWSVRDADEIMNGYYLGDVTVKKLREILNAFPDEYKVSCCGAASYLYALPEDKYITIDSESYLPTF